MTPAIRVGTGFDAHQLAEGRPLMLGAVEVSHARGLVGHSDGDALIHAIIDALLGAAGLGDIGQHFPSSDASLAGISSLILLERTLRILQDNRWQPGNVDAVVIAQQPRLAPYVGRMRQKLAEALGLELEAISVKATTTDHLGFTGREEGIAATAVATVVRTADRA